MRETRLQRSRRKRNLNKYERRFWKREVTLTRFCSYRNASMTSRGRKRKTFKCEGFMKVYN